MIVKDGFIIAVQSTDKNYNEIMSKINTMPIAEDGYAYRLRADTYEWELYELPTPDEAEDENEEITLEDALAKLRELGVDV